MRRWNAAVLTALLAAAAALLAPCARSATLEELLMPGPLTSAHSRLEADCGNCHDRTNRARQRELCLDCHKAVAGDLRERRGFHGRRSEIATAQCSSCHSDHLGRTARIQPTPGPGFDHRLSDFALDGAHRSTACAACHMAGKPFREAPGGCVNCHRREEPHQGRLGTDCASCHATARWSQMRFDHDTTDFALVGRHAQIPCAGCHAGNRWAKTPTACASCHTPDDVHRGQRGNLCADCHTQQSWKDAKFDHEKETGFALRGAHRGAACQACHRSGRFTDDIPRECAGCHRAIDAHAGRLGSDCASCHTVDGWKPEPFNHAREAGFELAGSHARLGCHSCHVVPLSEAKPPRDCAACHRGRDAHADSVVDDCAACHGTTTWRTAIRFDHDVTSFALLGQHTAVPCAGCHGSLKFGETPQRCESCHRADDVHRGGLGTDCAACHHPNAWNKWRFDHARESGFALTGAHERLQCGSCHRRPPAEASPGRDCMACHSTDDVHLGQFGRRCETCHSTLSFHRASPQ